MMTSRVLLEIQVRTPHGAPVEGATVVLSQGGAERAAAEAAPGAYRVEIREPGDYELTISRGDAPGGFEHRSLRAALRCMPEGGAMRVAAGAAQRPGGEAGRGGEAGPGAEGIEGHPGARESEPEIGGIGEIREEGGRHVVPVILDYLWFTHVGYPPTLGNKVDVLVDGEEAWASVAEALRGARASIHLTTWIYQPTTELTRPDPLTEPEQRAGLTAQRVLEERAKAGVIVRLLLWDAPILTPPGELLRASEDGDHFQVLEESNPTRVPLLDESWRITNGILGRLPIGSYHQKTAIIDERIGFCGGMNIKENDWDSREHLLFEPRRCAFSRPAAHRAAVAARAARPDHPPRHDFMARVEGPSAAHLAENFRERWNRLLEQERGGRAAARATPVEAPPAQPPAGSMAAQVVRTMPARLGEDEGATIPAERGIIDVYLRAIAAARRLIYVEDQYFRSTYVSDAIAAALVARPEIALVVLTSEKQANDIIGRGWARECFERIRRVRPDFELHALRVGATDSEGNVALAEVDNHAKLLIVDDRFLLVGSCNVNDRGFDFEGEIDVAVADAALARRVRVDLWREHLGGDARLGADLETDLAVWREHAERNRSFDPEQAGGPPASHVFPFVPRGRRWLLFGPDVV